MKNAVTQRGAELLFADVFGGICVILKNITGGVYMPVLKDDYVKTEKIDGVIYNMSPSRSYSHGRINGNIYGHFFSQLRSSLCISV